MRLIDADALKEENKDIIDCEIDHPKYQDTLRELIDQAPTIKTFTLADIEEQYRKGLEKGLEEARPHGEWISLEKTICKGQLLPFWRTHECSVCSNTGQGDFNFCPKCGADMRKEGETND